MNNDGFRHAFISYVHEDTDAVDAIEDELTAGGIDVWRDKRDLSPGGDWQNEIRQAIKTNSIAFIACFSSNSVSKERSFQNDELLVAVEELRLQQPGSKWFFPVRLDDCTLPHLDLGGGRALDRLQYIDLFGKFRNTNLIRLLTALQQQLSTKVENRAQPLRAASEALDQPVSVIVKRLLREPGGDIELDDTVDSLTSNAVERLEDQSQFPTRKDGFASNFELASTVRDMVVGYDAVVDDLTETMILGAAWGTAGQRHTWTRVAEGLAEACLLTSGSVLARVEQYPLLQVMYATSIASVYRGNFFAAHAFLVDAQVRKPNMTGPVIGFFSTNVDLSTRWVWSAVARAQTGELPPAAEIDGMRAGTAANRHTPVSDLLHDQLRPRFKRLIRSDAAYTETFDRAEVFLDAVTLELRERRQIDVWVPGLPGFGSYTWRYQHTAKPIEATEADAMSATSPMLQAGFFGGDTARAAAAYNSLAEHVAQIRAQRW